ncbi:hypothetical protein SEVIR_2G265450v4 [Setaria viridis]|uniref:Uncharacterized protein n=1 Tax=Setaria viridis TaxID=4556 RepID=A0A4U6VV61_SETVI|nr:hypothetical protein SEVIR_2G265450v2 [Setaria viridis]
MLLSFGRQIPASDVRPTKRAHSDKSRSREKEARREPWNGRRHARGRGGGRVRHTKSRAPAASPSLYLSGIRPSPTASWKQRKSQLAVGVVFFGERNSCDFFAFSYLFGQDSGHGSGRLALIGRQGSTASGRSTAAAALVVSAGRGPRVRALADSLVPSPAAALVPRLPRSRAPFAGFRLQTRARPCSNRRGRENGRRQPGRQTRRACTDARGVKAPMIPLVATTRCRGGATQGKPEACCRVAALMTSLYFIFSLPFLDRERERGAYFSLCFFIILG